MTAVSQRNVRSSLQIYAMVFACVPGKDAAVHAGAARRGGVEIRRRSLRRKSGQSLVEFYFFSNFQALSKAAWSFAERAADLHHSGVERVHELGADRIAGAARGAGRHLQARPQHLPLHGHEHAHAPKDLVCGFHSALTHSIH